MPRKSRTPRQIAEEERAIRASGRRYNLADGTDISGLTIDQIMAEKRRISPRFPSIPDAAERRLKRIENIIARMFLVFAACFTADAIFDVSWKLPALGAGLCLVGFAAMAVHCGNRQYNRSMGRGT